MIDHMLDWLGLKKLLPEGPVMSPWARTLGWPGDEPSRALYEPAPATKLPMPPLPVMAFGVSYDLDLVIVSTHPTWNMHEYAMLRTPQGQVWLSKDARESTLTQTIVADIDDIDGWMPEIPVQRLRGPVEVRDRSTPHRLDLDLSTVNFDGERVEVHYEGPPPNRAERKRNGSTMGHSRADLMAVLDLSHKAFARRASIAYAGQARPISRILGLVPFSMALVQTQGGLVTGRFDQGPTADGFTTTHKRHGAPDATRHWAVERLPGAIEATQRDTLRTLRARFIEPSPDTLELSSFTVHQWDRAAPTFHLALSPALPDLRRPFEGAAISRYVVDVGGQQNHAIGQLVARWTPQGPQVALEPTSPWWTADRPMISRITLHDDLASVHIERHDP